MTSDKYLSISVKRFSRVIPNASRLELLHSGNELSANYLVVIFDNGYWIVPTNYRSLKSALQDAVPDVSPDMSNQDKLNQVIQTWRGWGWKCVPLQLDLSDEALWPIIDESADALDVIFRIKNNKDIVYFIRRESAEVAMVVKLPFKQKAADGCKREFRMLQMLAKRAETGDPVAPQPVKSGRYTPAGSDTPKPYYAQSFIPGVFPKNLPVRRLYALLGRLRLDGQSVTLKVLSETLAARVAGLGVGQNSKDRLAKLLDMVTDRTDLPASIGHGDCWHKNMLVTPDDRLVALDWEFSKSPWLGFLDMVQATVYRSYRDVNRLTFRQIYNQKTLRGLENRYLHFFPSGGPDIEQIAALHFCQHYIDHAENVGGVTSADLKRREAVLHTDWLSGDL